MCMDEGEFWRDVCCVHALLVQSKLRAVSGVDGECVSSDGWL